MKSKDGNNIHKLRVYDIHSPTRDLILLLSRSTIKLADQSERFPLLLFPRTGLNGKSRANMFTFGIESSEISKRRNVCHVEWLLH